MRFQNTPIAARLIPAKIVENHIYLLPITPVERMRMFSLVDDLKWLASETDLTASIPDLLDAETAERLHAAIRDIDEEAVGDIGELMSEEAASRKLFASAWSHSWFSPELEAQAMQATCANVAAELELADSAIHRARHYEKIQKKTNQ